MSTIDRLEAKYHRLLTQADRKKQQAREVKKQIDKLRVAERAKQQKLVRPSVGQRLTNYQRAREKWEEAGKPERTDDQVAALRVICTSNKCGLFDGTVCTHETCGCPVARPGIFGDKLRWATEACPVGLW